jgi:hypothetical protein
VFNVPIIIERFNQNVKGRIPDTNNGNLNHDGREGYSTPISQTTFSNI